MQKMTHRLTIDLRRLRFENYENCTNCGYQFSEGDTSHSGYGLNDEPLYVCEDCSKLLKETAMRNYFMKKSYEVPNHNAMLWRYMDFTKYVSLLSSKGIYFTRTDCFEDPFEGAKGVKKNKDKWDSHYLDFFKKAIQNPPEGNTCDLTNEEVDENAARLLRDIEKGGEASKQQTFVSCWHENEHESEAMWRLYSSFLPNAVAIQTTYKRLYESLDRNPSIEIGRVKYIDLNNEYSGINDAFWRKRISFQHEREVRAVVTDMQCRDSGKIFPCNLQILIENVFVSPHAPMWFSALVNDINEKYFLNTKVKTSELNEEPFF